MTELKAEVLDAIKVIDGMTQWTVATSTSLEFLRNLLLAQNAQIEAMQKREEVLVSVLVEIKTFASSELADDESDWLWGEVKRIIEAALKSIKE